MMNQAGIIQGSVGMQGPSGAMMISGSNNYQNGGSGGGVSNHLMVNGHRVAAASMTSNGGIVYSSTSYDDNFAENKNTLAHSQFGFLPSILKSFNSFKNSQNYMIGA